MLNKVIFSAIVVFELIGCTANTTSRNDALDIVNTSAAILNTANTPDTAADASLPASCEQFYSAINILAQDKPPELIAQLRQMVADKRKAWKNMNSTERDEMDKQCVMLQELYLGKH